jgi:hypothetical protein
MISRTVTKSSYRGANSTKHNSSKGQEMEEVVGCKPAETLMPTCQGGHVKRLFGFSFCFIVLYLIAILVSNLTLVLTSNPSLADDSTGRVFQDCRAALSKDSRVILVDHWFTDALPDEYRQAAKTALTDETVLGWVLHKNPNGTSTVVISAFDQETREQSYVVLFKDNAVVFKNDVYAFEVAFSGKSSGGVSGLFFCGKTGPSNEWIWNGSGWASQSAGGVRR